MDTGNEIYGRLEYDVLPGTTALFRDFMDHHPRVADLYPADPRRLVEEFDPSKTLSGRDFSRQKLCGVLASQNRGWSCSPQTLENIGLLEDPDSLVVVTGQQVGLFTGPLFTIYKALTAVQLSRQLQERSGHSVVPLFWLAADDHDYEEIDHVAILDRAGLPVTLKHEGRYPQGQPVGPLELGPQIEPLLARLVELLPESEYRDQVLQLFASAYRPAVSFAGAFARTMLALFAEDGLVMVDPSDPSLKPLCQDVFRTELAEAPRPAELLSRQGDELTRRGYHAQLRTAPPMVNLFVLTDGRRTGLVREKGGFRLKGGEQTFTDRELNDMLETSPQSFSPSAALRPLVQDCLFPVAAYVAGPAEVAYFAQLGPLYELFGIPRPPVYPRMSITLLEDGIRRLLEKFGLKLEDLFVERDRLLSRVSETQMPAELEADIAAALETVRQTFGTLSGKISAVEPTMEGYLDSAGGKVSHHLRTVRQRLLRAMRSRDQTLRQQTFRISGHLYPDGRLQERLINIIPFLARHGMGLVRKLSALDVEPWEHLVIKI